MFNIFSKKQVEQKEESVIDKMADSAFPVIPFFFNGVQVFCKVRCLNQTQLRAVGEFNLIDLRKTEEISSKNKIETHEMIEMVNWQEALMRETLIKPTFDEIQEKIYGEDNRICELKEKAEIIRYKIKDVSPNLRKKYESELNSLELYIGSLLPTDFMNDVTAWATGTNRSDIKKVTRDMLLEATILAKNGNDNPSDHMQGEFLDFHKDEINKAGWFVYNQYMEDKRRESEGPFHKDQKVIRGGRITR